MYFCLKRHPRKFKEASTKNKLPDNTEDYIKITDTNNFFRFNLKSLLLHYFQKLIAIKDQIKLIKNNMNFFYKYLSLINSIFIVSRYKKK